mmetsp:Transcript_12819/g.45009  ORF Transcript_12819/g.45009 Transcript_12819/m.45009 type:complete len:174 (-) Transcript_12819:1573-2094(-)
MSRYLSSTNSTDSANMMRYLKERQCSQLLRHAMSSYFQAIAKARQENDFDRLAYLEDPKSFFLDHFSYIHSESDQQQQEEPDHRLKTVDGPSNSNIRWSLRPTSAGGWQARQPTQGQNLLSLVDCDKDVRCQGQDSSSGSQRKRRRVSQGEIMLEESKFNAAADSNRTVATTI